MSIHYTHHTQTHTHTQRERERERERERDRHILAAIFAIMHVCTLLKSIW